MVTPKKADTPTASAGEPTAPEPKISDHATTDAKRDKFTENTMREYFAKQKKVSIKTRDDEWVQVNGYTFYILKDKRVEVPEDIANILEESGRI